VSPPLRKLTLTYHSTCCQLNSYQRSPTKGNTSDGK
jgi:hypothetical protein